MADDLICCVCDEPKGLFRTLMTREHPVCDRCYIAWYEGAGTDRESIRAALKLDEDTHPSPSQADPDRTEGKTNG